MIDIHPCPRCNRNLRRAGDATIDGAPADVSVFQCDECLTEWEFDGQPFETALTFGVDASGQLLNPDTFEPVDKSHFAI